MSELALFGGPATNPSPLPAYTTLGHEERDAALRVLSRGVLSDFLGRAGSRFLGGPEVQALEAEWCARFGSRFAVSVNSATSGIYAAVAAAGVSPGDEVVVSPFTMSSSAVGPFFYGATPVFADIDPETFCLTAATIERVLTPKTRAVVVVDLFGHPTDMAPIMELAAARDLVVIEDAAQAAGSTYHGKHAGTLGHLGVFSLNVHKIIQAGEGGVVVTDDERLARRLRLVRNHGEVIVREEARDDDTDTDIVGLNYRMTELEAAIGREQLKKLDGLAARWRSNTAYLAARLNEIAGLRVAPVQSGCTSVQYQIAIHYDEGAFGFHRDLFVEAVRAEGVPFAGGYVEPLYFQPLYGRRLPDDTRCRPGACPVAESMWTDKLVTTGANHASLEREHLDLVVAAVRKVSDHRHEIAVRPRGSR